MQKRKSLPLILSLALIACVAGAAVYYANEFKKPKKPIYDEWPAPPQLTKFPAAVRTAMIRLNINKGIPFEEIRFTWPKGFAKTDNLAIEVFASEGGGVKTNIFPKRYLEAVLEQDKKNRFSNSFTKPSQEQWYFNDRIAILKANNDEIEQGKESTPAQATSIDREIIAFLPGLKKRRAIYTISYLTSPKPSKLKTT